MRILTGILLQILDRASATCTALLRQLLYAGRIAGAPLSHNDSACCFACIRPYTIFALVASARSLRNALAGTFAMGLLASVLPSLSSAHPVIRMPSASTVLRPAPHSAPSLPFYIAHKGHLTLYVLGTLHVGRAEDYPPPYYFRREIQNALRASAVLAFELSPDDLMLAQDTVQRYGVCTYSCLLRLLPAALWHRLVRRLHDRPAELAEIRKIRPWLAAMRMDTLAALAAGLQTEYSTEAQLENVYTAGHIVGLETYDEQILAFAHLTRAEQSEMLVQSLTHTPEQSAADMHELHRLWRTGDADRLAAWQARLTTLLMHSPSTAQAVDEKTLYQRNRLFVARILLMAEPDQPFFVAIGALHLGGPRGVLALLRQHGFDVQSG